MQDTSRTGYLLRVRRAGSIEPGLAMELVDRASTSLSVQEAARVVNRDRDDWEHIERLVVDPALAPAIRDKLTARLAPRDGGNDRDRLYDEEG